VKKHTQLTLILVVSVLTLGLCCQSAYSHEKQWDYSLTPYLWFASIDGEYMNATVTRTASADFGDLLDDLNMGLLLNFEAWKMDSHWGVGGDLMYVDFEKYDDGGELTPEIEVGALDLMVAYRFGGHPPASDSGFAFDLCGGIRLWRINAGMEVENTVTLGARVETWQPFIGARLMWEPSDKWLIRLSAKYGILDGTEISGLDGDLNSWDLYGGVGYYITENTSLNVGYRWLDINVEADDRPTELDIEVYGPTLELTFNF